MKAERALISANWSESWSPMVSLMEKKKQREEEGGCLEADAEEEEEAERKGRKGSRSLLVKNRKS